MTRATSPCSTTDSTTSCVTCSAATS
jgi:hypothetical protein